MKSTIANAVTKESDTIRKIKDRSNSIKAISNLRCRSNKGELHELKEGTIELSISAVMTLLLASEELTRLLMELNPQEPEENPAEALCNHQRSVTFSKCCWEYSINDWKRLGNDALVCASCSHLLECSDPLKMD